MKPIPPLNPLRAFEAAARTGSISSAAQELHVTPTAISRHVRSLEQYLDIQLFERKPSSLKLTHAGKTYAAGLSRAFSEIARATTNLKVSSKQLHLSLRSYTTFMVRWLMPRLPMFQLDNPDVHIQLSTGYEEVNFERDRVDIWIRYGRGLWPGFRSQLVFMDCLRPFASSLLENKAALIRQPEMLSSHVLLRHSRRIHDWEDWYRQQGLELPDDTRTLDFDDLALVFEAAASGLGIGITQEEYLRRDVRNGRFFWPFDTVLERDIGYFALSPLQDQPNPAVEIFLNWLSKTKDMPVP